MKVINASADSSGVKMRVRTEELPAKKREFFFIPGGILGRGEEKWRVLKVEGQELVIEGGVNFG